LGGLVAPRVSPDGATVAFSAPAVPEAAGTPPSLTARGRGAVWEVWTVPIAGGEPRQLTRIGEALPTAAWSRDGAQVLVQGDRGRYLVEVATGATMRVSADGGRGGLGWWSEPEDR
jgi:Tol biopolymer transport system component